MKIQERWRVEGIHVKDNGLLNVEFDSRQETVPASIKASEITHTSDGDDQIIMPMTDGKAFAERVGERVDVVLEIDDGRPRMADTRRAQALDLLERLHTGGHLISSESIAVLRRLLS